MRLRTAPHLGYLLGPALAIGLITFWLLASGGTRSSPAGLSSQHGPGDTIPNLVHFVYVLEDAQAELRFKFGDFLSIYAAWYYWRPDAFFLHTNAARDIVERAKNGETGKWTKQVLHIPNLQVNYVTAPTHAKNGKEIENIEHKSDFVRVEAMREYGGIYIDFDVHPIRDIRVLRETGFKAIAGRQFEGQINSGVFMSVKGGRMIRLWSEGIHEAYTGGWTTHSNEVITRVGERLVSEPGEMLIMEREAFAPGSWNADDCERLFQAHEDAKSALESFSPGQSLPTFDEDVIERWDFPTSYPSWAVDWSRTYMVHAFNPYRFANEVKGFTQITPRYVLERQSNFARAVYPVARDMYENGLLDIEDSYD